VYGYVYVDLDSVLVSLNTGLNPRNFFKLNTEDANNYYITIREIQDGKIVVSEKTDKINDEALRLCNNRSNIESGDVLFSGTGTIGETAVVGELPFGWNIKEGVYSLKPDKAILDSKYLRYLLMTGNIKNLYMKKVVGGTVKSIPMKELRKLVIPLPSLEEQQHIAKVIEQFDAICSDLQSGLPAEIEKRLKQYEYYRDKLLSFKEL
jgi:type I restriction enzyme S subunit